MLPAGFEPAFAALIRVTALPHFHLISNLSEGKLERALDSLNDLYP